MIAFDDEVDRRYLEVEQGIEALLARQTPVAVDLRLVLAMLHINLHLERMADYCVTIAKLTKLVAGLEPDSRMIQAFEEMGERAEEMIQVALDAFVDRDVDAALPGRAGRARSTGRTGASSDRCSSSTRSRPSEWGVRMLLVSRCLERIGDHAVDIGEQVAYLVTAEFREFTDASHPVQGP